jgi:hypothetical protein
VDIYNVTSGSWTTATLSIPRYFLAATSSQNLVFFGGGRNDTNWPPKTVYDQVDIYNTLNGSWSTANLSQPRSPKATSAQSLVFFGGGRNKTGGSDRVDIYNVTSGSWTTATLSIPRYDHAVTSSQNLVFFGGGWNGTNQQFFTIKWIFTTH